MGAHLKWAGKSHTVQCATLEAILRDHAVLMYVLKGLRDMELPDHLIGSGAIYNCAWNHLTGKPLLTGTKDIDIIYFDDSDLSYEAEDRVIRTLDARFRDLPVPVEVRNQTRVHLWFPDRFGFSVPPLTSSAQSLLRYASKTHAVAVRLEDDGRLHIEAPFGLDDLFSFRITPNQIYDNKATHEKKAQRAKAIWPELAVVPW